MIFFPYSENPPKICSCNSLASSWSQTWRLKQVLKASAWQNCLKNQLFFCLKTHCDRLYAASSCEPCSHFVMIFLVGSSPWFPGEDSESKSRFGNFSKLRCQMVFFFPKLEVKHAVWNSARAGRYCLSQKQDAANHLSGSIVSLHKAIVSQPLLSVEGGGASAFPRCPSRDVLCLPAPEPAWAVLCALQRLPVDHPGQPSWRLMIPRKRIL